jgi:hypothetical protein
MTSSVTNHKSFCGVENNLVTRTHYNGLHPHSFSKTVDSSVPLPGVGFNHLPCVLVSLIESFLPASSICSLSSTSRQNRKRWTVLRWKLTFKLHYSGPVFDDSSGIRSGGEEERGGNYFFGKHDRNDDIVVLQDRWSSYHKKKFGEWENSFVGCCCHMCESTNIVDSDTEFNVNALVPSLMRAYGNLWDRIELSMLGYNDIVSDHVRSERRREILRNVPSNYIYGWDWNMITSGLAVISKVANLLLEPFLQYATFFRGKAQERRTFRGIMP